MNQIAESPVAHPRDRYAIVAARFNQSITEQLIAGAMAEFARHNINSARVDCFWVPGAFEIPMACRRLTESLNYVVTIALGAVIRGETSHFDYVAGECARGIARLNQHGMRPVIFGVLTTDTVEQAMQRADAGKKNKGADAVLAALQMVELMRKI